MGVKQLLERNSQFYAVLKVNRIMEVAFENDLPLISLVQSV
jgi:hypothetical protein